MDRSHAYGGFAWLQRDGRDATGVAVSCRILTPPLAAAMASVREVLRDHNKTLPSSAGIVNEWSGGTTQAPLRLVVLYPPGTARTVGEVLADRLRALPVISDVAVAVPADGDKLPSAPGSSQRGYEADGDYKQFG